MPLMCTKFSGVGSLAGPNPCPSHASSLGWNKRIEYTPGAGSLALFPSIHLETCDEPLWNIQAMVELQTNHVAKGCDRDNYSEKSLRKLCGELILSYPFPQRNWEQYPCASHSRPSGTYSSCLLWSAAVRTPSSKAVLRDSEHPACICKGPPVLSLLGSQRFLCGVSLCRVCGTSFTQMEKSPSFFK